MKNLINTKKIIDLENATNPRERLRLIIKDGELCGGQNFNVFRTETATYIAINSYGDNDGYKIAVTLTENECVATVMHSTDYGREIMNTLHKEINDISTHHWGNIYHSDKDKIEEFISIVCVVLTYEYRKLETA